MGYLPRNTFLTFYNYAFIFVVCLIKDILELTL